MSDILEEFAHAQAARVDSLLPGPTPPRQLHHYTTLDGLRGIVAGKSIWATDVRYMNDASELSYAAELITEVTTEVFEAVSKPTFRDALPTGDGAGSVFEMGLVRPFAACFCEHPDLLSQWRGYRADDTGYAVGLDLRQIASLGDLPPNTYLRKVVYGPDEQRGEVRKVAETWLAACESIMASRRLDPSDLLPYPALWALQRALTEHHLCFKHPGFQEEQEWRLIKLVALKDEVRRVGHRRAAERWERMRAELPPGIQLPDLPDLPEPWGSEVEGIDIKFRSSAGGLVPFVDVPLRDAAGIFADQLPLARVTQGPTSNPELADEALQMYLESLGYTIHTSVVRSEIPLRE
jgi:hypothetical protein